MSVLSITKICIDCDAQDRDINCHCEIDNWFEGEWNDLGYAPLEDFLSEHGWLVLGDQAWCPECRKQMHD